MTDTDTTLQPKKKGLTRRQKRSLSRGVQYAVFVAAVIAFAVTADWDRLQNQFAQADLARQMFPDRHHAGAEEHRAVHAVRLRRRLVLGMVIALMRLSSVGAVPLAGGRLHRDLPRPARPC
ncbi:hypothetical protein LT493_40365 [Streptomyces tricolor]|nr:hypothetical protein [Streptomyces tricolor]